MSNINTFNRKEVGEKKYYQFTSKNNKKVVSDSSYLTDGENFILVKGVSESHIILNNQSTEHIIIKSLTKVKISCSENKIDEDYQEIIIGKGTCVEFYLLENNWYIVSSDGLKIDQS